MPNKKLSASRIFGAAILNALGSGITEGGKTYREYALKELEANEPTSTIKTLRQIDPDFETKTTEEKIKMAGAVSSGYPSGRPEPNRPAPSQSQEIRSAADKVQKIYARGGDPKIEAPEDYAILDRSGVAPETFKPRKPKTNANMTPVSVEENPFDQYK
jgi:hypothetical protein